MRKNYLLLLFFFICLSISAQKTSVRGKVIDSQTNEVVKGISVQLTNQGLSTFTELDGTFLFDNVAPGQDVIEISSPDVLPKRVPVDIQRSVVNDVGMIGLFYMKQNVIDEGMLGLLDESSFDEEGDFGNMNVSSLMTSSDDVYLSATSFNFSAMRFDVRGYDSRYSNVYINGVSFNDQERGVFSYGMIGGLNDATRSKDVVNALMPSNYTYSQIGGSSNINTYASNYAPGGKASVAYTNRSYKLRGMATYSTGLMSNGWAVTGSVGYRWADEGYIPGSSYNSLGYLLAIEKVINPKHRISLTTMGTPTQRGQQMAATQEAYDLADDNYYNPNWGWQDGEKRNARIVTSFEPTAILSHIWTINKESKLTTGLGVKYTRYGGTALNWYNSSDPRPDYYRYLPSYQTTQEMKDYYTEVWQKDETVSQVNWDRLYNVNELSNQAGESGRYMIEERRNDQLAFTLNSVLNTRLSNRVTMTAGFEARTTKGMHFKTVSDLLGSRYFLDVDQFSERDFSGDWSKAQNDLNNPDRKAVKGDRFGYDYDIYVNAANVWMQNSHRYNKWDVYYGFKISYTEFWRDGNMRNGRAPDNSYGKGTVHSFVDQGAKFGLAYKLSGRHIFSANVSYASLPPITYNSYLSARIKDNIVPNLESENVFSADVSYNITTPVVRARISAFQTNFYDQTEMYNYYHDLYRTFVNYAMTDINKIHRGLELGASVKLNSQFSVTLAGTIAEYFYNNRPTGTITYENGSAPDITEKVYLKNFYVGGTPQTAGTFGIHYFHPQYWFVDLNINGFDRTYVDLSPTRRTESAFDFVTDTPEEKEEIARRITKQEEFAGGFTLDLSIGKVLRIQRKYQLNLNMQFNNILNNTGLKTGGYEQGRYDFQNFTTDKFPNKYYYALGFNCFLNAGFKF